MLQLPIRERVRVMAIRVRHFAPLLALAGTLLAAGCSGTPPTTTAPSTETEPDGPDWFEDISKKCGLRYQHDVGPLDKYWMHQMMGSGCAIHDLDNDSRPDLVLLNHGGPGSSHVNGLYRQTANGTFEDVAKGSGLDFSGWCTGLAIGDVDRDGLPDVAIMEYERTRFFRNLGGMKFQDATESSGIRNSLWGSSAAFFDYDRDGRLDLLIVNYLEYDPTWECRSATHTLDYCNPSNFKGTSAKLFRNLGPAPGQPVRFEDVSVASRIGDVTGPGLGVSIADVDGNGWPDVFVANDGKPNRLWMNQGTGVFREEATTRGVAYTSMGQAFAGMGVAMGDFNNDRMTDFFVTHLGSETNTLWMQGPRGVFQDRTLPSGLTATRRRGTGFGAVAEDFDHDGDLDIAVVNGRVARAPEAVEKPGLSKHWAPYAERHQFFSNSGDGRFTDLSVNLRSLCGFDSVGRGLASGDIDGDGAPDLLLTSLEGPARVLRNAAPNRGHWLAIRAIDPAWNGPAIGATVEIQSGKGVQSRIVSTCQSYLSAGPATVHFGLGATTEIQSLRVAWPDGQREEFPLPAIDRVIEVRKGSGAK